MLNVHNVSDPVHRFCELGRYGDRPKRGWERAADISNIQKIIKNSMMLIGSRTEPNISKNAVLWSRQFQGACHFSYTKVAISRMIELFTISTAYLIAPEIYLQTECSLPRWIISTEQDSSLLRNQHVKRIFYLINYVTPNKPNIVG